MYWAIFPRRPSSPAANGVGRHGSAGAYGFDGKGEREVTTDEKAASLLDELVGQAEVAPTHLRVCQGRYFAVAEVVDR